MTSEVALVNQRIVALAADSAVTSIANGQMVVRNEHRKLFNLMPGRPLGVMFYGLAEILGHPWDHIIEQFQRRHGDQGFPTTEAAANAFLDMLDDLDELFPPERQRQDFQRIYLTVIRFMMEHAAMMKMAAGEAGANEPDRVFIERAINQVWHRYMFVSASEPRSDLANLPRNYRDRVQRLYREDIERIAREHERRFELGKDAARRLREIAVLAVTKDFFLEDVTGLVFAGFGADQRYPSVVTAFVSGVVAGVARRKVMRVTTMGSDLKGSVQIFADGDMTKAFIRGVDPLLEETYYGVFAEVLYGTSAEIIEAAAGANDGQKRKLRESYELEVLPQRLGRMRAAIEQMQHQRYVNPILQVIEVAGRDEMAETARAFVDLNAFRKRVVGHAPTVGGAIDVAVITREGYTVWRPAAQTQS